MSRKPVRSKDDFLIFGAPAIEKDEIDEVVDCLRSGWLGTGPKVAQFEKDFQEYNGSGHPVAVNSCTAALHLSMIVAGLKPGDEVITSAMTFCASVNAIVHAGLTPIIVDVDPETMNLDPNAVEANITPKTRAILAIHFAGRPCDMDALEDIAKRHNLKIVEDCAHAIETEYHGRKVGAFGDFGCFSFYVTKNVITGEGGLILARNEDDAARLKTLALHGMTKHAWTRFGDEGYKHYHVVECGFKYNMMDIQAAIGIHQLRRVEMNWQRREEVWNRYNEAFAESALKLPAPLEPNTRHAYHLYTVFVDETRCGMDRDAFLEAMTAHNIGVGVHYLSIPEHPYYQKQFGWKPEEYPAAQRIGLNTVSLPLSAKLTEDDIDDVIEAVRRVLDGS